MSSDPLAPVLTETQWRELDARRQRVLAHVAHMEKAHGSRALPW
jgi:hypothetical protein